MRFVGKAQRAAGRPHIRAVPIVTSQWMPKDAFAIFCVEIYVLRHLTSRGEASSRDFARLSRIQCVVERDLIASALLVQNDGTF